MPTEFDATAWTATLLGLYALFAGIGGMRSPGIWRTMVEQVSNSAGLQLLAGLLELVVGALVYLANPWIPSDLLSCVLKAMGGLMMMEALTVTAFGDVYTQFWLRTFAHMHRALSIFMLLGGLALAFFGMERLG